MGRQPDIDSLSRFLRLHDRISRLILQIVRAGIHLAIAHHIVGNELGEADTATISRRGRRFTPTRVGTTRVEIGQRPRRRFTPTRVGTTQYGKTRDALRFTPTRVGTTASDAERLGHRFTPTRVGTTHGEPAPSSRFTPTRVGTTAGPSGLRAASRFTPTRVGTTGTPTRPRCVNGSPPRAWGRRRVRERRGSRHAVHPHARGDDGIAAGAACSVRTVHPHARGDDAMRGLARPDVRGSPPRAWGRLHAVRRQREPDRRFTPTRVGTTSRLTRAQTPDLRFTPTRVGTTLGLSSRRRRQRFTPTRVGTTPTSTSRASRIIGSPPRAWGRLTVGASIDAPPTVHPHARGDDARRDALLAVRVRFTPTRVGTTRRWQRSRVACDGSPPRAWGRRASGRRAIACVTVHPHARGDDALGAPGRRLTIGSPPRAWGRRSQITGEADLGVGSPPRAWGRLRRLRRAATAGRFTPTRVGTTTWCSSTASRRPVHPHARGDDARSRRLAERADGSPPRAWGRRTATSAQVTSDRFTPTRVGTTPRHRLARAGRRFTPTRVGTTRRASRAAPGHAVHPHARGDDADVGRGPRIGGAVHPHARGDDLAP